MKRIIEHLQKFWALIELARSPRYAYLRSASLFASIGTVVLGLGMGMVLRTLERDNAAFVQQSIGDTGSMLSNQVKLEVDRLKRVVLELAELRLKPQSLLSTREGAMSLETDPEILEVTLWRRSDLAHPFAAVNSRYAGAGAASVLAALGASLKDREAQDRSRIEVAFRGRSRVSATSVAGTSNLYALLVVPMGRGEPSEAISAIVSLERFQKLFPEDGLVQSGIVDLEGMTLAHADARRIGRNENAAGSELAPLFEHLSEAQAAKRSPSELESGIQELRTSDGKPFFGGFRRIPGTGLAVLSSVPAEQAGEALDGIRHQLFVFLLLAFAVLGGFRHWQLKHRPHDRRGSDRLAAPGGAGVGEGPTIAVAEGAAPVAVAAPEEPVFAADAHGPRQLAVVALHGSMRALRQLIAEDAREACDAINDFLAIAHAVVREHGGHFECGGGAAFDALWELDEGREASARGCQVARAVECLSALKEEITRLNGSRKVDGKPPLSFGAGLHVGQALSARLGVVPELRLSIVGEAPACARALDSVAVERGRELVVSDAALKAGRGVFTGESLGEIRLTADTGLTACYAVTGFAADAGLAEGRFEGTATIQRPANWLVNNGSQIVGPLTPLELARMLFAQELDFDCECWNQDTGRPSRLAEAGIFSGGSQDASASFWVYDGKLVHGPVTEGFVRTAIGHGAFGADAWVCENSTVAGWKRLSEMFTTRKPETGSGGQAA